MLVHRGLRFQSGRGIGSFFGGLFRRLKPLFSMGLSAGKKFLASDTAKQLGSTALDIGKEAAKNVAVDLLSGGDIKESLNKELDSAKSKIADKLRGGGRRRKTRKRKRKTPLDYEDDSTDEEITRFPVKRKPYNLLD